MDVSKLAQRLAKLQEKSTNKPRILWSPKEELSNIRILPYKHQENNEPYIELFFHYNVAGIRSILCPKGNYGKPCPICDLAEEFKDMGGRENWKISNSFSPKLRTFSPIIIRGREDEGVFLWGYGTGVYEELISTATDPDWGDYTDILSGRDIKVKTIKPGSEGNEKGNYPKPVIRFNPNQTPLFKSAEKSKKFVDSIPNFIEEGNIWILKTNDELVSIVEKLGSSDEKSEFDYNSSRNIVDDRDKGNGNSLDDTDNLKSKLDKLLGSDS